MRTHMLISLYPHMLISTYPHIHISSASASQPASQPASRLASRPASQPGSIGRQVRFWGSKSANVTKSWQDPFFFIRVRRFLMVLGRRSAKVAPKRVLSAQDAFRDPKNIKKRRTRMPKCGLCHFGAKRAPTAPLERLGAFGPLRTPKNVGHVCKSAKVIFCNFIFIFSKK